MQDIINTIESKLESIIAKSLPEDIKPIFELYINLESARNEVDNPIYNINQIIKESIDYIGRVHSSES